MGKSYLYALGIGSNMGERKQNLQNAVSALARLPKTRIMQCAAVYESAPVGCGAGRLYEFRNFACKRIYAA